MGEDAVTFLRELADDIEEGRKRLDDFDVYNHCREGKDWEYENSVDTGIRLVVLKFYDSLAEQV